MALKAPTLGWALRRTLLGIVILFVTIAAAACLLYASIDPDEESAGRVLRHRASSALPFLHTPSGAAPKLQRARV